MTINTILVTGATGYVGGRLVPRLLEEGYRVRAMVRGEGRLQGREWREQIEVVHGDVLRPETLASALEGVDAAYYLIHSMGSSGNFAERDLQAAGNFARAAAEAGLQRIIYLSGLGDPEAELSEHLRSLGQATGDELRNHGVDVTEFRAAIIVGSGSASFEMIRHLTERLPVMICPQWVFTHVQPIAIRNVLEYLVAALAQPQSADEIVEIGGEDVLTYGDMMKVYAKERGLHRLLIPVPVLTPGLSSHWVHWTTPIPARLARPLIEGLRNEVVVRNQRSRELFPDIKPMSYRHAVRSALDNLQAAKVETAWADAQLSSIGDREPTLLTEKEGMIVEKRQRKVEAPPEFVFQMFQRLGGETGWLAFDWAWWARGVLDRVVGGVGFRRGRRDPHTVRVGDALDFWRVEAIKPDRLMRLRAEMKVPGRAWLQFETMEKNGETLLIQTAYFAPKGLLGRLYWLLLYPFHGLIFSSMADRVKGGGRIRI